MKNFTLLFALLLPFFGFSQALSGNKTIGGLGSDYSTLASAVTDINQKGISGPVTFLLNENQNVTSPIIINQLSGTSATNTLTIKPNSEKTIIIQGAIDNNAVIVLNSSDNIIIDGNNGTSNSLTVYNSSNTIQTFKSSIILKNNADNNTIKNLTLKQNYTSNSVGKISSGIYSGSEITTNTNANNINNTFDNIIFNDVKQAIIINSQSNTTVTNLKISNCTIGSTTDSKKPFLGIYLLNVNKFTITKNNIDGVKRHTGADDPLHSGIVNVNGIDGIISNNNIKNISNITDNKYSAGIYSDGNNILIYNNFVYNVRANGSGGIDQNGYGIMIKGNTNKIYYNSVKLVDNQNTGFSAALFINSSSSGLDIRNNIFLNQQTSGANRFAVFSYVSNFEVLNYNNYKSSQYIAFVGTNPGWNSSANTEYKSTLEIWKTLNPSNNVNSKNIAPSFLSTSDLHLNLTNLTNDELQGFPITSITDDIDGEIRIKPYMGADEIVAAKCGSSTTWDGTWSNGTPNDTKKAIIAGNYSGASFIACELQINSNVSVTVGSDKYIQVVNGIVNNGTVVLENKASLIQTENDATYTGNPITVKKITTPMKRYDFTYWSSPVKNYTLYQLSPETLGDKYYSYNPVSGWFTHNNGAEIMQPGKGYIIRAPQSHDINTAQVFSTQFTGVPNTGTLSIPVATSSNLIGNPYPSAISADEIYKANSTKMNGTFYFWTHNTLPSNTISGDATYNYTSDDYASYNVVGGVKTKPATSGGVTPTGNIASGQSFFITGTASGNVTFNNSMRVKLGNNSQFFRIANQTQSETNEEVATIEKHRLWLNITNEAGDFNETLVGYISNATNGFDDTFDGETISSGATTLYTLVDNKNLVIQGRSLPFANTDVVPLGIKISTAGQYKINMDQFDGLFLSQNIYLFDSLTNTTHDLKANDYVFNSEAGTFDSRFEIRYVNDSALGTDNPIITQNDVVVYKSANQISVRANNLTIDTVQVYDITGKLITSGKNINNSTFTTSGLNVATQVVIVKVTLDDNQTISKKVIMN